MADKSTIEWTGATWNPITGCSIVSPGCTNCYAMKLAGGRLKHHPSRAGLTMPSKAGPVWNGKVRLNEQWLDQPLRWKRPRMIFVCAHGDLFHEDVPDEWIDRVFAVMALAPQHTFQVLTKRSARMRAYMNGTQSKIPFLGRMPLERIHLEAAGHMEGEGGFMDTLKQHGNVYSLYCSVPWPLPNVWLGVSAERRQEWMERTSYLWDTPAAIRFVSVEPLLGDLGDMDLHGIDWVIVGGESGLNARPMHPAWARSIRDQCAATGTAFFFKQWGTFATVYDREAEDPDWRRCNVIDKATPNGRWLNLAGGHGFHGEQVVRVDRVGKKAAGRLLDGIEHNGMPQGREVEAL